MGKMKFEKGAHGVNRHHLVARSEGGSNHPDNLLTMQVMQHRALHILHGNNLPLEQLRRTLGINTTTLIDECRDDIQQVLNFWEKEGREAYNPNVLKGKQT